MSAMKIKKGDTVKVIAGKDNGKEGKVLAVNAKDNTVVVENINKVTKHSKPSAANQQGGIITKEAPLHISNVMLVVDGQATRVGFQMDGDKKVRVAKKTGKVIDLSLIHISEPTRRTPISYAVFCLKKKTTTNRCGRRQHEKA